MKLVPIPAGSFSMGQDGPAADYRMNKHPAEVDHADWDEKPAHPVTITQPFQIGATEVTVGQYRQFKTGYHPRSGDDEAATGVSWFEAVAFCEWLSKKEGHTYRLPTEAEWEYACRAGATTLFNTGDTLPGGYQRWFGDLGRRQLYFPDGKMPPEYQVLNGPAVPRVAQSAPNAWGLLDMHGNVAEWCADWYGPYEAGAQVDPLGRSDGNFRVFRGGAHSSFTRLLRSANRGAWIPESVSDTIGFRVVQGELPKGILLPPPPAPLNAQNVSQSPVKIEKASADTPFFSGPKPFVRIPANSAGPLFSWHNHSPAITECPNGDLLAVWFSCVDEGGSELCNAASRLRLGATEWEPASPFWDGADVNDHAPKLWWDGDHTLFHFARGLAEDIVRTSTDNGATWSKARTLFPHGELSNRLLRTREGVLIMTHDGRTTSLVSSRDGGKSWSAIEMAKKDTAEEIRPGGTGHRPPGIHAPIVELADGRLMAISRQDLPEDQARFHSHTPVSISSDEGKTWTFSESEFPAITSVQRAVLIRLHEGPLLLCSYTDPSSRLKERQGLPFKSADGKEFTGCGLFAAVSYDDGQTWPFRRLITPGGAQRTVPMIDRGEFILSDTSAEPIGYLAVTQTRDDHVQLLTSKNHYVFNLAWLKTLPVMAGAAADAHLIIQPPAQAEVKSKDATPLLKPAAQENFIVYKEAGRYGGWPANHGLWQWGDELVAGFTATWYKDTTTDHRIDRTKPSYEWQARSLDGGKTWKTESDLPFADPTKEPKPTPLTEPLDFTAPDFALMFRFGGLHAGPSWFYASPDRCKTWRGPYRFAVESVDRICTRTDLIVLGPRDCLMFGSCAKQNDGKEGRPFCARTTDGGLTWKLVALIGPEPQPGGYAIMPSSLRLKSGALITTIRRSDPKVSGFIECWRSDDLGATWKMLSLAAEHIGGNPPALVQLPDGRLAVTYGHRHPPVGMRARLSADEGRTWGPEIAVRDGAFDGDMGYPRAIVRPDGRVMTVYYFNGPRGEDRAIEGTLWTPPTTPSPAQ
ncbi:MAG: SUMF1/EgtB/PvdO family nonheme iron enzyme [Chthoniobacter sp.]